MAAEEIITLTRGDSLLKKITIYKNGEAYTPEEGELIKFNMKRTVTDEFCAISKVIPNDTLILELKPEDTKKLKFGKYIFEIEITDKNERVYTFLKGSITLTEEIG